MPVSVAIVLPTSTEATFPDACVVCGKQEPQGSAVLLTRDGLRGRNYFAGWFRVRVPCCPACGWRMRLGRWWRLVRTVVVGLGLVVLFMALATGGFTHELKNGTLVGILCLVSCVISFAALALYERFYPPAFTVTVLGRNVSYEIRDPHQAIGFAEANGAGLGPEDLEKVVEGRVHTLDLTQVAKGRVRS
jgi:hypothetical protein